MVLQASTPPARSYSCDRGGGTLRVHGFTIEIKPQDRGGEMVCHASIRSPQGEIVYENDNNLGPTDIDPVTGKDINGDGYPDAVLVDDTGSAHHDDFSYSIFSLGPKPVEIAGLGGIVDFEDLNKDGKIEIRLGAPFLGFHDLPSAYTPGSQIILRLVGDHFEDISTKFPKIYDGEVDGALQNLRFHKVTIAQEEDDQSWALSAVFAYLFSGRPGEARKFLDQHWPAAGRESIRKEILSAFCAGRYKDLGLPMPAVCAAGNF